MTHNASPFSSTYASAYDSMYAKKDYGGEVDEVLHYVETLGVKPGARILDIGCGTGGHAFELARRGYHVTGVDLSEGMLMRLRQKAATFGGPGSVEAHHADARSFDVMRAGPFDAALFMFAVLGYLTSNDDLRAGLANARRHLKTGGVLLFDVWFGPAVLTERPGVRTSTVEVDGVLWERRAESTVDVMHHTCTVRFTLTPPPGSSASAAVEEHVMRYFFPQELPLYLELAGFELVGIHVPGKPSTPPSESTWNVQVVARALVVK